MKLDKMKVSERKQESIKFQKELRKCSNHVLQTLLEDYIAFCYWPQKLTNSVYLILMLAQ